jgi:hypothetical protein
MAYYLDIGDLWYWITIYSTSRFSLVSSGFSLRLRDLFNLLIASGDSYGAPFPVNFSFSDLQIECCWVHLWNKVGQSGVVGASLIFADVTDRASSPLPTFPLAMSTKQPAHRRKGGSVEVVDSKYAVDLATQQSYSENVFLFVPNLIG